MERVAETSSTNPPSMLNMLLSSVGITTEDLSAPVEPTPVEPTPLAPAPVAPAPAEPAPVDPSPAEPVGLSGDLLQTAYTSPLADLPLLDYCPPASVAWIPTDLNIECDEINFYDFKQDIEPGPSTNSVVNDTQNLPFKKRPLNEDVKMLSKKGRISKKMKKCPSCTTRYS